VALAHDATHVNTVAGVQSPSTSRAPPLESAGRSAPPSAASELTDEELELELELQPTRKAATKIARPVLTILRR